MNTPAKQPRASAELRLSLVLLLCLLLCLLTGCGQRQGAAHNANGSAFAHTNDSAVVLRIGHQRADPLNLLRLRGGLEKRLAAQNARVEWVNFQAGPPLLEALSVGSLDFGSTGDLPPIFAQAAGNPIVYVANIPLTRAGLDGQAILVPANSPIHTVADLKGKRVAFAKGSGAQNLVIQTLAKNGLSAADIQPLYLAPPDARIAFEAGQVDAWAIWDPYIAVAQHKTQARVLVNMKDVVSAGAFYLSSRAFALAHPDILRAALEEVKASGAWAAAHPHDAASLLAQNTGVDTATLEALQNRLPPEGILPIDAGVLDKQQFVADTFQRAGLIPAKINVREAALSPQQYAALAPVAAQKTTAKQETRQ